MFDQISHREGNGIAEDEFLIELDNEPCIRTSCKKMDPTAFLHVNMLNFHIRWSQFESEHIQVPLHLCSIFRKK